MVGSNFITFLQFTCNMNYNVNFLYCMRDNYCIISRKKLMCWKKEIMYPYPKTCLYSCYDFVVAISCLN